MLIWIGVTLLLSMAYPTLFALIVCYGIFDGESPRTQFIFYGLISIGTPYFFRQMAPGLLRALVPK